jgi:hypothetical protein
MMVVQAFPLALREISSGAGMLSLVAYDITDEKRLRASPASEDYGVRVQYSVFECRLDGELPTGWGC